MTAFVCLTLSLGDPRYMGVPVRVLMCECVSACVHAGVCVLVCVLVCVHTFVHMHAAVVEIKGGYIAETCMIL